MPGPATTPVAGRPPTSLARAMPRQAHPARPATTPRPVRSLSARTPSVKAGGGSCPVTRRCTSSTAAGSSAWVAPAEAFAEGATAASVAARGAPRFASTKSASRRPSRSSACSSCSWYSSKSSKRRREAARSRASRARRSSSSGPSASSPRLRLPTAKTTTGALTATGRVTVPSPWRARRSISAPAASTRVTSSGICPSACVAHDRHGSKARIATSMWLSSPSVSSWPLR